MSTVGELNKYLASWRKSVRTQLKEYRVCMTLPDHAERLKRLLAASIELEQYRMNLEEQLDDEISSGDHAGETQKCIQRICNQTNKINEDTRKLVVLVSMIVEQRKDSPIKQRPTANLMNDSIILVKPVNCVESKIRELLDSIKELSKRLDGNGAPTATGRQAEEPSAAKPGQRAESA